ncbi:MAG: hypothetical protein ACFFCQ_16595 [Promethearchaeota archaeon]
MIHHFSRAERSLLSFYIKKSIKILLFAFICLLLIHYAANMGFFTDMAVQEQNFSQEDISGNEEQNLKEENQELATQEEGQEPATQEEDEWDEEGLFPAPPHLRDLDPALELTPEPTPEPAPGPTSEPEQTQVEPQPEQTQVEPQPEQTQEEPQPEQTQEEPQPEQAQSQEPPISPETEDERQKVVDPIPILLSLVGFCGLILAGFLFIMLWTRTPKEVRNIVEKGTYSKVHHRFKTSIIEEDKQIRIQVLFKIRDKGRLGVFQLRCLVPPFLDINKIKRICGSLGLRFDYRSIMTEATLEEFMLRYYMIRIGLIRVLELEQHGFLKQYV